MKIILLEEKMYPLIGEVYTSLINKIEPHLGQISLLIEQFLTNIKKLSQYFLNKDLLLIGQAIDQRIELLQKVLPGIRIHREVEVPYLVIL